MKLALFGDALNVFVAASGTWAFTKSNVELDCTWKEIWFLFLLEVSYTVPKGCTRIIETNDTIVFR